MTERLRPRIVLGTTEAECTVVLDDRAVDVPYAQPFPRPRSERVVPGNLVAIAALPGGADVVAWRWFDAVVLVPVDDRVRLWEPFHGLVEAQPRDPARSYRPGTRAYLSAGLPGAQWWVAGPVVERAEDADVELDEVEVFFTTHDLWARLA